MKLSGPAAIIVHDTTSLFSDISAGSVGSPEGYTTLIVRNPVGKSFLESAVQAGDLVISREVDPGAIEKLGFCKDQEKFYQLIFPLMKNSNFPGSVGYSKPMS